MALLSDQPDPEGRGADGLELCVSAGGSAVSLPLSTVLEVLRPLPLTRVPHAPPALLGVCALRGAVLPVLSLPTLLEGAEAKFDARARIVVAAANGARVGLMVDAVLPSATATARRISPSALLPAGFGAERRAAAIAGTPSAGTTATTADTRRALLGLRVGGQVFALPLDRVEAVASANGIEAVPDADRTMPGVVTIRDGVLPVLHAAALLGLDGVEAPAFRHLVLLRIVGRPAALAVDALLGILRVAEDRILPVPPLLLRGRGETRVAAICRLGDDGGLAQLLDPERLLDAETMARLSLAAQEPDGGEQAAAAIDDTVEPVLVLQLGQERYGLPLAAVDAVLPHPERLTLLPNAPPFVEGTIALRGRVLPVVDQRGRFGAPPSSPGGRRRIVVLRIGALRVGLAVDGAREIARLPRGTVFPLPDLGPGSGTSVRVAEASTEAKALILLLDPAALLEELERDMLRAHATGAATS